MKRKSEAGQQLINLIQHVGVNLIQHVGVPYEIHRDGAPEMGGNSDFSKVCREYRIRSTFTEPHSPWQNKCENTIGVLRKKVRARRARRRIPKCIWDFHIIWEAQIYTRTVHRCNSIPLEALKGDTIDISDWTEFEFYGLVLYWDNRDNEAKQNIGRWLGVSHHVGSALCYYILTERTTVLSRTTIQHFTKEEFGSPEIQERVSEFRKSLDQNINRNQYTHDSTDVDFIRDDVLAPIGSGFSEGEYFG